MRVPAALMIQRGLDELAVMVDPDTFGLTELRADATMVRGVEAHLRVFAAGDQHPLRERRAVRPGLDFGVGATTWSTKGDGIPVPGVRYAVEVELVAFETDIPPSPTWTPRAGRFKALWTRTLRQAEE